MDPSSTPDPGTLVRGSVPVIILVGVLGVGLSVAASPDLRGVFGAALALLMLAIAVSDIRRFIIPNALSASAFVLGLIFAGLFDDTPPAEAVLMCLVRAAAAALPLLALMLNGGANGHASAWATLSSRRLPARGLIGSPSLR